MLTRHPLAAQFHQWLNQPAAGPTPPPGTPTHPIWYQYYDASDVPSINNNNNQTTNVSPRNSYQNNNNGGGGGGGTQYARSASVSSYSGGGVGVGGASSSSGYSIGNPVVTTTTSTTMSMPTTLTSVTGPPPSASASASMPTSASTTVLFSTTTTYPATTATPTPATPSLATVFPTNATPVITATPASHPSYAPTLATVFPSTTYPTPTGYPTATPATVFPTTTITPTPTTASSLATVFPTPTTTPSVFPTAHPSTTLVTAFPTVTAPTPTTASSLATVFPTQTPTPEATLATMYFPTTETAIPPVTTAAEEVALIPAISTSSLSRNENNLLFSPVANRHSNNGYTSDPHDNIPSHLLTPTTKTATVITSTPTSVLPTHTLDAHSGDLRPIDHSGNIAQALLSHYNNALTSDLLVVFGDLKFYCHKLVLAAQSEIFTQLLFGEGRSSVLEIPNPHRIHPEIFTSFLHYLYSGTLSQPLTSDNILYYIHLSTIYTLPNLASSLLDHIPSVVTKQSLLSLWATSLSLDQPGISHKCQELVFLRTREVIEGKNALKEATPAVMRALVNSDMLNIEEIELFIFLQKWAAERNLSYNNSELLRELVSGIRFALMSVRELEELQGHEYVTEPVRLEALGHVLFGGDGGDTTKTKRFRPRTGAGM